MQTEETVVSQPSTSSSYAVELKGSVFTLPVLQLRSLNLADISQELEQRLAKAITFFQNAGVVIDLSAVSKLPQPIDFAALLELLRRHQLIAVGVRNGSKQQHGLALGAGLALLKGGTLQSFVEPSATPTKDTKQAEDAPKTNQIEKHEFAYRKTKVVTQPVRSGQQIYAMGGDLIVMAPVNAGAEVMADANVHVYAPMRGRVLAGVRGDTSARIFCQSMEAELIAIAGNFRVFEDNLPADLQAKSVQAYLDGEQLIVSPL